MDFMQETGNRQQKVLTALLLGRSGEAETETKALDRERQLWEAVPAPEQTAAPLSAEMELLQAQQLAAQAEEFTLHRRTDALWRNEPAAAGEREVPIFQTLTKTVELRDANAISRLFQRDARRYDGSFRTD